MKMLGMLAGGMAFAGAWTGGLALFTALTARKVERALPPLGRFMNVAGHRLHYLDIGSGPALVMIHGLGGQMRHFTHGLLPLLSRHFRVILVDRPGSGHSTRPPGADAGPRAQAAAIAGLIRTLGLTAPLLVGHSLGGAVALSIALDHPDCAGGLALIAPLTRSQKAIPACFKGLVIGSPLVRWLLSWTLATPLAMAQRDRILEVVFGPDPIPADFGTNGGGLLGLRPGAFQSASADLMAAGAEMAALEARYAGLHLPVAILFGRQDRVLDWRHHGEAMGGLLPSVAFTATEGGHMLPLTAPGLTADWLERTHAQMLVVPP